MKKKVIWLMVAGLMTLALLAVSCYSAPAPAPAPVPAAPAAQETTSAKVKISGFTFVPPTITIAVGTTVTWSNQDSVTHTVSSQGTLFDSGNLARDATFSYTFTQPGTVEYRCKIHPSIKAKVVVE